MKNFTRKTLSIFVTMLSFSSIIQSEAELFQKPELLTTHHHNRKGSSKIIIFTPDTEFGDTKKASGDIKLQGRFKNKNKTAIINYNGTIYLFNKITEDPNPILPDNKLDLVHIGFFSNKTNRADMPVTSHLFGLPSNNNAKKVAQAKRLAPKPSQEEIADEDDFIVNVPLSFTPEDKFNSNGSMIGEYFNKTQTASIYDPLKENEIRYTFEYVQEELPASLKSNNVRPMKQPMLIGSYISDEQCSKGTPKICPEIMVPTQLYGTLKENN